MSQEDNRWQDMGARTQARKAGKVSRDPVGRHRGCGPKGIGKGVGIARWLDMTGVRNPRTHIHCQIREHIGLPIPVPTLLLPSGVVGGGLESGCPVSSSLCRAVEGDKTLPD